MHVQLTGNFVGPTLRKINFGSVDTAMIRLINQNAMATPGAPPPVPQAVASMMHRLVHTLCCDYEYMLMLTPALHFEHFEYKEYPVGTMPVPYAGYLTRS